MRRIEDAIRRIAAAGRLAFVGGAKHDEYARLWTVGTCGKKAVETKPATTPVDTNA